MEKKVLTTIKEGSAEIFIHKEDIDSIPSKAMNVFYNKKMELNRDISNLAILAYNNLYPQDGLIIVDSMAASGVSSIRMLKECENIKKIYINDLNPEAVKLIKENIKLNGLEQSAKDIEISRKDANFLFREIAQSNYLTMNQHCQIPNVISIDPFGTPNLYINSAFNAIQKVNGLMCITATDTAVLFGVRPNACIRKYMSKPLRTEYCKEIGARILIYFISRMANVNKLGIIPLLTFYSNHFVRIFALTFKDKKNISKYFTSYGYIIHCKCGYRTTIQSDILELPNKCPLCGNKEKMDFAGPLWLEEIHDIEFLKDLVIWNDKSEYFNKKRISKILDNAINEVGMPVSYYNIHKLSRLLKTKNVPRMEDIIENIKERGFKASRTHFDPLSIKSDMDLDLIKKTLLNL
jgi:tRNA (guanine26-N2/guanine27-N2)-dimethyltransferase